MLKLQHETFIPSRTTTPFKKIQDAANKTLRLGNNLTDPLKKTTTSSKIPQVALEQEEAKYNADPTSVAKKSYIPFFEPPFHLQKIQDAANKTIKSGNNQFTDFYNAKKNPSSLKIPQVLVSCNAKTKAAYPKMHLNALEHEESKYNNDPSSLAKKVKIVAVRCNVKRW